MEKRLVDLLPGYRSGDPVAQQEFLDRRETLLRAMVRKAMGPQVRTERESMDVCQSIMLAFHLGAAQGTAEFENDAALGGYLMQMIRHKMANLSDRIRAVKRGGGIAPAPIDEETDCQLTALNPTASMAMGVAELHARIAAELSEEDAAILRGRLEGRTNKEIAERLGKTPDAVRMSWNRAREQLVAKGVLEE